MGGGGGERGGGGGWRRSRGGWRNERKNKRGAARPTAPPGNQRDRSGDFQFADSLRATQNVTPDAGGSSAPFRSVVRNTSVRIPVSGHAAR
jgi:hypothetical protein